MKNVFFLVLLTAQGSKPFQPSVPPQMHSHPRISSQIHGKTKLRDSPSGDFDIHDDKLISRRLFFASALVTTGTAFAGATNSAAHAADTAATTSTTAAASNTLPWEKDPVNKRSGITVFDAEKAGYNVAFVTYLSRILLNFDPNCQRWWFSTKIPNNAKINEIEALRINQFAAFSASVEIGLQAFEGKDGPEVLLKDLVQRYGTVVDSTDETQRRLARSARRQIALLFGLLEKTQPVAEITKLLASVDNGSVTSVQLSNTTVIGGSFETGKEPRVVFPPPEAGEDGFETAEGRAILKPTGRLLRIDVLNGGSGYSKPPDVIISPPRNGEGTTAKAQAKLTKGSIESIQIIDYGSGYAENQDIKIELSRPDDGEAAIVTPVLEMAVDRIEITKGGSGYATEKPLKVSIGVGGNLQEVGLAYPSAEKNSFTAFRGDSDKIKVADLEAEFEAKYNMKPAAGGGTVSAVNSEQPPPLPFWGGKSTSADLLRLLPAGIGLEYDMKLQRYSLSADTDFLGKYPAAVQVSSNRPLGTEFGPRGRAPIERDMTLGVAQYLRFALSGAICASGVHLALTPLDVAKTKIQVDSVKYQSIGSTFGKVWKEEGPATLFTGWLPTLVGNFASGAALYGATEFIRRSLSDAAGVDAIRLEVPIILISAAIASSIGAVLICPFEAVRIRTVAQPDFAPTSTDVLTKMVKEEGIGSLVNAIPIFLVRNVPYAMTKFLIFDLSTERLFETFPAAQEQLSLSLLVSLVGGILGGTAAAVVSNPADTVISELKKAKSDISPQQAVANMLERAGPSAFFVGLPLRMVFYSLVASMTFVVYDSVRFALGIGSDDLKLYLDVLGGALNNSPLS